MTNQTQNKAIAHQFVVMEWHPFTCIMPRELARRLASGAKLSVAKQTVTGGDPNYPHLPPNARELTAEEIEDVRKSILRSHAIDPSPKWWAVTKAASSFIFDIVVLMICVALLLTAYLEFSLY